MSTEPKYDFSPVKSKGDSDQISRPSLSYWQDSMRRFRQNKRAFAAFLYIAFMIVFCLAGPLFWKQDPAAQDLSNVSKAPGFMKKVLIFDRQNFPALQKLVEITPLATGFQAPKQVQVIGKASTHCIDLQWQEVSQADGYKIWRNELPPVDDRSLGIPLADIEGQSTVYRDMLKPENITYYYSVQAVRDGVVSSDYTTTKVKPVEVLSLQKAVEMELTVEAGEVVRIRNPYPLGTDSLGRDMLSRIMTGGRVSLYIGFVAPFLFMLIGTIYGGIAGYVGGKFDNILMRLSDFVVALPFLLFMILFKVAAGNQPGDSGIKPMMIALVVLSWPGTARLVRGQILKIREEPYVQAAQLLGANRFYIVFRHMIPNTLGVILVSLSFAVPSCIFTEAFLSFIGMGIASPDTSWGAMCQEGVKTLLVYPYQLIIPALFISGIVLAFNILGDGLRDALDSQMRSK